MPGVGQQSQVFPRKPGGKPFGDRVREQKDAVADGADRQAAVPFAELAVVVRIEGGHVALRLLLEGLEHVLRRQQDHVRMGRAGLMALPHAAPQREVFRVLLEEAAGGELGPGVAAGDAEPPGHPVVPVPRRIVRGELCGARPPTVPDAPVVEVRTLDAVEFDPHRFPLGDDGPGLVREEPAAAQLPQQREDPRLNAQVAVADDVEAVARAVQDEGLRAPALQVPHAGRVRELRRGAGQDGRARLRFRRDGGHMAGHLLDDPGELLGVRAGERRRGRGDDDGRSACLGTGNSEGLGGSRGGERSRQGGSQRQEASGTVDHGCPITSLCIDELACSDARFIVFEPSFLRVPRHASPV